MINIEKDIPVPEQRYSRSDTVNQFADMKVGDSFGLPFVTDEEKRHANAIRSTFNNYTRRVRRKMRSHTSEGVLRLWRTE